MKKMMMLSMCTIFVAFLVTGAASSQSSSDYKAKIESLNKEMTQYMIEGNTEKSLNFYTADAISLPSYSPILEGIANIRKANEDMAKTGSKINSCEFTTLKVIPNGNLITEIGTYKINMSMPGMDKAMDDHGKYLTIWEKQKDGSLKVKIDTWNSDINPMDMSKMQGHSETTR